jgi:hypothetical protein
MCAMSWVCCASTPSQAPQIDMLGQASNTDTSTKAAVELVRKRLGWTGVEAGLMAAKL